MQDDTVVGGQECPPHTSSTYNNLRYYRSLPLVPPGAIITSPPGHQKRTRLMSQATGAETARQKQELNIFHDVAKALTSSLDLDSILQTIMEKMAEYFRPDTWSLLMVDEEHNE